MKDLVYIAVNENSENNDILYASTDVTIVRDAQLSRELSDISDEAEELGYDEDLSNRDMADAAFMSGYNNGDIEIYEVEIDRAKDYTDETFELNSGDTILYSDIIDTLNKCECGERGEVNYVD